MDDAVLTVAQGSFELCRYPERPREQLRAWDAADELLLARLAGHDPGVGAGWSPVPVSDGPTLVLADAFGALTVPLAAVGASGLVSVVDSSASAQAIRRNAALAEVPHESIDVRSSTDDLSDLIGSVRHLVVRPPRTLALLEHLLRSVRPLLHPEAVVVGAEMTKHLHSSTLEVFERVLGPTLTTRAHRRARALECRADPGIDPGPWPWPRTVTLEPGPISVVSWPGVFSAGRLDRGTALLLEHLPETDGVETILDLGCGNGVLGTVAAMENPEAEVVLVDDSALAIASAAATFAANLGHDRPVQLVQADSLVEPPLVDPGSVGLVLCNPPFHEHRAMGDATAWQMFTDARRVLRPGGELWVVGNRHLGHHAKLARIFGNSEVVASSPKFVVVRAQRS